MVLKLLLCDYKIKDKSHILRNFYNLGKLLRTIRDIIRTTKDSHLVTQEIPGIHRDQDIWTEN